MVDVGVEDENGIVGASEANKALTRIVQIILSLINYVDFSFHHHQPQLHVCLGWTLRLVRAAQSYLEEYIWLVAEQNASLPLNAAWVSHLSHKSELSYLTEVCDHGNLTQEINEEDQVTATEGGVSNTNFWLCFATTALLVFIAGLGYHVKKAVQTGLKYLGHQNSAVRNAREALDATLGRLERSCSKSTDVHVGLSQLLHAYNANLAKNLRSAKENSAGLSNRVHSRQRPHCVTDCSCSIALRAVTSLLLRAMEQRDQAIYQYQGSALVIEMLGGEGRTAADKIRHAAFGTDLRDPESDPIKIHEMIGIKVPEGWQLNRVRADDFIRFHFHRQPSTQHGSILFVVEELTRTIPEYKSWLFNVDLHRVPSEVLLKIQMDLVDSVRSRNEDGATTLELITEEMDTGTKNSWLPCPFTPLPTHFLQGIQDCGKGPLEPPNYDKYAGILCRIVEAQEQHNRGPRATLDFQGKSQPLLWHASLDGVDIDSWQELVLSAETRRFFNELRHMYTTDQTLSCEAMHVADTLCTTCSRRVLCHFHCNHCSLAITMSTQWYRDRYDTEQLPPPNDVHDIIYHQLILLEGDKRRVFTQYPFERTIVGDEDRTTLAERLKGTTVSNTAGRFYHAHQWCREHRLFHVVTESKSKPTTYSEDRVKYDVHFHNIGKTKHVPRMKEHIVNGCRYSSKDGLNHDANLEQRDSDAELNDVLETFLNEEDTLGQIYEPMNLYRLDGDFGLEALTRLDGDLGLGDDPMSSSSLIQASPPSLIQTASTSLIRQSATVATELVPRSQPLPIQEMRGDGPATVVRNNVLFSAKKRSAAIDKLEHIILKSIQPGKND